MTDLDKRVDFAWRVHDALDSWTAKVDNKASIVLAIEGASAGLVVSLAQGNGPLAHLTRAAHARFALGSVLLAVGAVCAALAVFPQLGRLHSRQNWRSGIIYFGHLRHWDPTELAANLRDRDEVSSLDQLANQHVTMSKIAWRKHSVLQVSMIAFFAGVLLLYWASWR